MIPELRRIARRLVGRRAAPPESGEKSADWYDESFESDDEYSAHYTRSTYYPSWTVIVDRIRAHGSQSVLEIACGPGQLACALLDSGLISHYVGFDFSPKRVEGARRACPAYRFEVADAFQTSLFSEERYDTVVSTEFLEHIEDDLGVLKRIRRGTHFVGTVPNYPYVSHVRHFLDVAEVHARYGALIASLSITPIIRDDKGHVLFLMEGVIS
jgi:SAM-dependent methyltransferase